MDLIQCALETPDVVAHYRLPHYVSRLRHYQKNHEERRQTLPPKQGGFMVSIFVNFRPMTLKKKSEILECDPDVETKIHGHRIFYTYTTFYIEKKFFCFLV